MRSMSRRQVLALAGCLLTQCLTGWTKIVFAHTKKSNFSPVRFGVLSDPHVDLNGFKGWKMGKDSLLCLRATVGVLNKEDLDFVLILGDLLNDGELKNLVSAKKLLDTLKAPYFIIAGNHDYRPADPVRQLAGCEYISIHDFVEAFNGCGYNKSGCRYWARRITTGLRLIGLDGCLVNEKVSYGGFLPQEQIRWLEKQLTTHKDGLHIIMLHHNLVHWGNDAHSVRGRWFSLDNSEEVRALLEVYADNIGVVFSGHRHIGLRIMRLGCIHYMTLPSVNSYPMRYALFQLSGREISWKTPDVPVTSVLHRMARKGLISEPWVSSLNKMSETEIISFYENNELTRGLCQL